MTREEAIEVLNGIEEVHGALPEDGNKIDEALSMAIKALEQEPCTDAISRQAAIEAIYDNKDRLNIAQAIRELPPVKPQEPKTGHWEEVGEEYIQVYDLNGIPSCGDERICSECGFETVFIGEHCSQYKFCPNCGARMIEPQERSENVTRRFL